MRGRTASVADVAVVLVACDDASLYEGQLASQTEETLLHAEKWNVPVVFALTKIDLLGGSGRRISDTNVAIDRAKTLLAKTCKEMHRRGSLT
jgi:translation initiation factor IF-2